jgi:hypothetical protein
MRVPELLQEIQRALKCAAAPSYPRPETRDELLAEPIPTGFSIRRAHRCSPATTTTTALVKPGRLPRPVGPEQ